MFEFPSARDSEPFDDVLRCHGCGAPLPISDYVIYKGNEYHRRCLPEVAKKVATEV